MTKHQSGNPWPRTGPPRPPGEPIYAAARERLSAVAEVRDLDGGAVSEDPSGNAVLLRASDA